MTAANVRFIRSTLLSLMVGGAILLLIVASSLYLVYKTQEYVAGAVEARLVRSSAADMLSTVQDAESGQRGFLLTLDPSFLSSYRESIDRIGNRETALENALKRSKFFDFDIPRLRQLQIEKVAEMRRTIDLAETGRSSEALAIVRSQSGLDLMTQMRSRLVDLIAQADSRIANQVQTQLYFAGILRLVTVCGAIAILALLMGTVVVIQRYIRELLAARTEMQNLNAGLEERVRERTEDLMQANQEIQRYAYIVTHDLRAPLVNIMGFTSELNNALKSIKTYFDAEVPDDLSRADAMTAVNEDLPEAIEFIRSSTRKMDGLINAILKISRDGRRPLKPEMIDLAGLIQENADSIQHQLSESGGSIELEIAVTSLVSDRFSLSQIMGNLFDNAAKYKSPSRPLMLKVRAFQVNRYRIGIDVTDNGRGIAAEDHERIFELFRRSGSQENPGEGIGLAHVRSLIRNMGGDIHVKSELGKGTTFMIRLPSDLSQFVGSIGQ